ncbi:MAG: exosortase K [Roseivirga sp.]|nr:exosortase K [Roseivirga sp.]
MSGHMNSKSISALFIPLFVIALCLAGKWWHINSSNTDLLFLLSPLNFVTTLFASSAGYFDPEVGYYHKSLSITIDKSCAGFNFLIMAFGSIYCMLYRAKKGVWKNLTGILSALFIAYGITLTANCSRILISVKTLHFSNIFPWLASDWFHEAIGSFVFVSALIGICLFIHRQQPQNSYA